MISEILVRRHCLVIDERSPSQNHAAQFRRSRWYARAMVSAWAAHENRAAHASRAAREGAEAGSASSFATASDHAPTSTTGTNAAAGPLASRMAGMSLATTADPHAKASITGSP